MQTYGKSNVTYAWYAGNSGVTNRSGRFIASHIGHTGLICFGAGANTLFELARYDSALLIGDQCLVSLPHLAGLGIDGIENGVITDSYGMLVVAVLHLIFSAMYADTPSARKVDASPPRPLFTRGLDGAELCVATARPSRLM